MDFIARGILLANQPPGSLHGNVGEQLMSAFLLLGIPIFMILVIFMGISIKKQLNQVEEKLDQILSNKDL